VRIKSRPRRFLVPEGHRIELTWASATSLLALGVVLAGLLFVSANTIIATVTSAPQRVRVMLEKKKAVMTTAPERLVFDVDHMDWQRIRYHREIALRDGINLPTGDDYVSARIRWRGESIPVRMRLKGVYSDHWAHDTKWSFRIKVKGDNTILGMKRFSIQHPGTRNYLYEWLFLRAVMDENLIALRLHYVDVAINGEERGIYALAEHFGKRLIEANRFREGPIVGFDKDLLIAEYRRRNREQVEPYAVDDAFWLARVDGTQTGNLELGTPETESYLKAASLLEAFRQGEAEPGEVFDLEKMARGLALKALFGASEFDWRDTKFYYNPVTGQLEPIVAEVHHQPRLRIPGWWMGEGHRPHMESFTRRLFDDPAFVARYLATLRRLSEPAWLEAFLERHEEDLYNAVAVLRREFPGYGFDPDTLVDLQKQVRTVLDPLQPVRVYLRQARPERLVLEVGSLQHWPLRVQGARDDAGRRWKPTRDEVVPGKLSSSPVRYRPVVLARVAPAGDAGPIDPESLRLDYRIAGLPERREAQVQRWPHLRRDLVAGDPPRQAPKPEAVPFVQVREAERVIDLVPGQWVATRNVILPSGYRVHATEGFHLDLRDGALLLSRSALDWVGTPERPIVIESSDGTGQGLAVIGAGSESRLEWVVLRGLGAPRQGGWRLTGAVTFYESDVVLRQCLLEANTSGDDLLNVVRSRFTIEGCRLERSRYDALDADFGEGHIRSSLFREAGDDGIDLSGSHVQIQDVRVDGAGDKGLSLGEASRVRGRRIRIRGANLGVAVKDRSWVQLSPLAVTGARIGLAVFQKKPEFGSAYLRVDELEMDDVERPHLVESGSRLQLEGRTIEGQTTRVADRLYDAEAAPAAPAPSPAGERAP